MTGYHAFHPTHYAPALVAQVQSALAATAPELTLSVDPAVYPAATIAGTGYPVARWTLTLGSAAAEVQVDMAVARSAYAVVQALQSHLAALQSQNS